MILKLQGGAPSTSRLRRRFGSGFSWEDVARCSLRLDGPAAAAGPGAGPAPGVPAQLMVQLSWPLGMRQQVRGSQCGRTVGRVWGGHRVCVGGGGREGRAVC